MNSTNNKIENYEIDAKGKAIGRIATEVVKILVGKNKPNYTPNMISNAVVTIKNINKISISQKKIESTLIYWHSQYPGGLKTKSWLDVFKKSPEKLFIKVISNMLPDNRHKKELLKRIKFN